MDASYKKRTGTNSSGHLYETKLNSLILFKLLHNDKIKDFHLASNMDEIGNFDDICLAVKLLEQCEEDEHHLRERSIVALIQAKHKENKEELLKYDLIQQLSASFVKVRQKFYSKDTFFNGNFDTDCVFILYTNAKYYDDSNSVKFNSTAPSLASVIKRVRKTYESSFSYHLNKLLVTGNSKSQGCLIDYSDQDIEFANKKILEEEINMLAKSFAKFRDDKTNKSLHIMQDYFILRYHVILLQSVVKISEVKSEKQKHEQWRELKFQDIFFTTDDVIVTMLRNKIYEQILKTQIKIKLDGKVKEQVTSKDTRTNVKGKVTKYINTNKKKIPKSESKEEDQLIKSFLSSPSALTLSPLIGTHIIYKNDKLKFSATRPVSDLQELEEINSNITHLIVNEAAKIILTSLTLEVPATFGNVDLKLPGDEEKIEKRLNTLTQFISNLCTQSKFNDPYEIVTIDESVGNGFLILNGGIGSAIGNLLIYDNNTKLLMFTRNCTSQQKLAQRLLDKLIKEIKNLYSYRFDVDAIVTFPKLVFDYKQEAKAMFKHAVVYDRQSNHSGVEEKLKEEIEQHHRINGPQNLTDKIGSIVIHYHNEIHEWWMSPKTAKYLMKSKNNNLYQKAFNDVIEPQMSAVQTQFNENNVKHLEYNFNESEISLALHQATEKIRYRIVSNIITLTTIKVIQCLKNVLLFAILDLEHILKLSSKKFTAFNTELRDSEKLLIIIFNMTMYSKTNHKRLCDLAQSTQEKKLIIISNKKFFETVEEYFLTMQTYNDEQQGLINLTFESRMDILKNTKVTFQGVTVSWDKLLDKASIECIKSIKGSVLKKIISYEISTIGKSLNDSDYDTIEHHRPVSIFSKDQVAKRVLKTFNDMKDDAVLILAEEGMGKSTLLTHLSLKTKQINRQLWIVRIDLLDYTKQFKKWQDDKTIIDITKAVEFMCEVVLNNNEIRISLKETDNKIYLDAYSNDKENNNNEWTEFEINMFLHFFNERSILLLFDGFDDICPRYKETVTSLLKLVKEFPGEHKMWVTSRPYDDIVPNLKETIGNSYEIELS